MDVKPWDDETDMKALEGRTVSLSKMVSFGASKLVPIGYGIKKLQTTLARTRRRRSRSMNCRRRLPSLRITFSSDIAVMQKL